MAESDLQDTATVENRLLEIVRDVAVSSESADHLDALTAQSLLSGTASSLDPESLDILDIALKVEEKFGMSFPDDVDPDVFITVSSLATYLSLQSDSGRATT